VDMQFQHIEGSMRRKVAPDT